MDVPSEANGFNKTMRTVGTERVLGEVVASLPGEMWISGMVFVVRHCRVLAANPQWKTVGSCEVKELQCCSHFAGVIYFSE